MYTKRKIETTVVHQSKRKRTTTQIGRENIHAFIRHLIAVHFQHLRADQSDLVDGEKIATHLHQAFSTLRQRLNSTREAFPSSTHHGINMNGRSLTLEQSVNCISNLARVYSYVVVANQPWISIVARILTFSSLFKHRVEELSLGHTRIPDSKKTTIEEEPSISEYGLQADHEVLLEGIRYPPIKQSDVASSLGPLTQVYCLRNTRFGSPEIQAKFEVALNHTLAHLPYFHINLIKAFKTVTDVEFAQLNSALGDLLLVTGARDTHEVTLPINVLIDNDDTDIACPLGGSLLFDDMKAHEYSGVAQLPKDTFGVSSVQAVIAYNRFMMRLQNRAVINIPAHPEGLVESTSNDTEARVPVPKPPKPTLPVKYYDLGAYTGEVVFHATFGTYRENLNLLKWMTSHKRDWTRRVEMGSLSAFANLQKADFEGIIMEKYLDPSNSNPPKFVQEQVWFKPVFASIRTTPCDSLIEYMDDQYDDSFEYLVNRMLSYTRKLKAKNQGRGNIRIWGTRAETIAQWKKFDGEKIIECDEVPPPLALSFFINDSDDGAVALSHLSLVSERTLRGTTSGRSSVSN